jgi:Helix-turn-helix domain
MASSDRFRFGIVQAAWFANPALRAEEIAVLAALAVYADPRGFCWPSQSTLARALGRSRSWVIKVLNRLQAAGVIERTRRTGADGGMRTCLYRLIGHDRRARSSDPPDALDTDGDVPARTPAAHRPDRDAEPVPAEAAAPVRDGAGEERSTSGATVVDPTFLPSVTEVAWARERRPDIDPLVFTEFFIAACRAKGYRYHDHAAAWRSWLLERKGGLPHVPAQTRSRPERPRRDWRQELAERNERIANDCIRRFMERRAGRTHPF